MARKMRPCGCGAGRYDPYPMNNYAAVQKYRGTPRGKYNRQKQRAKERGIAFLLTFEQWWKIWQSSGLWERRGSRPGFYCMCRKGDHGPYADGNVFIGSFAGNLHDGGAIGRRVQKARTVVARSAASAKKKPRWKHTANSDSCTF
jgi:hypothetical protein